MMNPKSSNELVTGPSVSCMGEMEHREGQVKGKQRVARLTLRRVRAAYTKSRMSCAALSEVAAKPSFLKKSSKKLS